MHGDVLLESAVINGQKLPRQVGCGLAGCANSGSD
jgi:hypothetical protein